MSGIVVDDINIRKRWVDLEEAIERNEWMDQPFLETKQRFETTALKETAYC